ncbi:hybrid sensor histidine kinase/response regulator [Oscillatoria sp. FACHB-1407]|uniref:hybrid sensor histidine kinase/response regulator n=1 Tax=Oscillatoria sp. FACHB-1407 TaxID=2692847 RepID=UPI001689FEA1|nr:hybrid sensor histidine kinase/response regulator [Oscillatoria sp. FACHB-1407]MBD2463457.1 hybrid sensor histidine kinase/response regulator [Oscillatoria sp. FACHB-1407]
MSAISSILIVDDELENFDVLETMLLTENYQLHYAANGIQALSFLETHQPDLILLDVMMPEMDGIEACRQIKSHQIWKHIPIVMVTALNSKEDSIKCLDAGATDFLSKPVHSAELRARVRSMLRIKQQHDDLQKLLQLREDMVSIVVHDLRNPLSSILLAIDLLRLSQLLPEKCQDKINIIDISAHQLQLQIDSLLLMAKIESGKLSLNFTEVDLCALCSSVLNSFETLAEQKRLTLIGNFPEPGSSINIDANIFRRMLDNLVSNAIKFSSPNGKIILQADYSGSDGVTIQITDEGYGINEATKNIIFNKYEIGTQIKGVEQTGLGLAFVKMAVEAHGGKITVENNQPKGTIFTLHLPA